MSKTLELKIEKLTATIEALNATLLSMGALTVPVNTPESDQDSPISKPEPTEQVDSPNLDYDDVKQRCLEIVRADRSKRDTIKGLLSDRGAKVVSDLSVEELSKFAEALEDI